MLEAQLELKLEEAKKPEAAAEAFVEGNVAVDVATRTVTASALFKWYKSDFGETDADVLGAIAGWTTGSAKTALAAMLGDGGGAVRLTCAPFVRRDFRP